MEVAVRWRGRWAKSILLSFSLLLLSLMMVARPAFAVSDLPDEAGGIITISSNAVLTEDYEVTDTLTIDLVGGSIATGDYSFVINGGSLTLTGNEGYSVTGNSTVIQVLDGSFTLSNVLLSNPDTANKADAYVPVVQVGSAATNGSASFTMESGDIEGASGIEVLSGSAIIKAGYIFTTGPTMFTSSETQDGTTIEVNGTLTENPKDPLLPPIPLNVPILTSTSSASVYLPVAASSNMNCIISNAVVEGAAGVVNRGANLTIESGQITALAVSSDTPGATDPSQASPVTILGVDEISVPRAAVVSAESTGYHAPSASLAGGTFAGLPSQMPVIYLNNQGAQGPLPSRGSNQLLITGGNYSSQVFISYLASNLTYQYQYASATNEYSESISNYYCYFQNEQDAQAYAEKVAPIRDENGNVTSYEGTVSKIENTQNIALTDITYSAVTGTSGAISVIATANSSTAATVQLESPLGSTMEKAISISKPVSQTDSAQGYVGTATFDASSMAGYALPLEAGNYKATITSTANGGSAILRIVETIFNANGGTISVDGTSYSTYSAFNTAFVDPNLVTPTRAGWHFDYWGAANTTTSPDVTSYIAYWSQTPSNPGSGGSSGMPAPDDTPSVDKEALTTLVTDAQSLSEKVVATTNSEAQALPSGVLWTTVEAQKALHAAIASAQALIGSPSATQEEVNAAWEALEEAVLGFQLSLQSGRELPIQEVPAYTDVSSEEWYAPFVDEVVMYGLMKGYDGSGVVFGPFDSLTRGQLAVILYRYGYAGVGADAQNTPYFLGEDFADVSDADYFYNAVCWANAQGIITGYGDSDQFGPNDPITREQLAVILYRFDTEKADVAATGNTFESIASYPESSMVNEWAIPGMGWAVYNEVLTGYAPTGALGPQDNVTRAQAAKMLSVGIGDLIGWGAAHFRIG